MQTLNTYIRLFLLLVLFHACSVEEFERYAPNDSTGDEVTAVISVSTKTLTPINMNVTKSPGELNRILSQIEDLNVRIYMKDGSIKNLYCSGDGVLPDDYMYVPNHELGNSGSVHQDVMIHCNRLSAINIQSVEVIANYGKDLSAADWDTLMETGDGRLYKGLDQIQLDKCSCLMYGTTDKFVESPHVNPVTHVRCVSFPVELKRTRAMISVRMDGTALNEGVVITPKRIRLCNVPSACRLTAIGKNKIEVKGSVEGKIYSLPVSQDYQISLGSLDNKMNPVAGSHAAADGSIPSDFTPLFLFENMQGNTPSPGGGTSLPDILHREKYPDPSWTVADAKDPEKNFKYSYLELEADYSYKDSEKKTDIGGTIVYRFFLGNNATTNFDVQGNGYYKLDLILKGFGGAGEDGKVDENGFLQVNDKDLSWRVDMNIQDWRYRKVKYEFDSHMVQSTVKVRKGKWTLTGVLKGEGNSSWLMINVRNYGGYEWANPTTIMNTQNIEFKIVDGKLEFTIQSMYYSDSENLDPGGAFNLNSYKNKKNYREIELEVQDSETGQKMAITVRQYAPIPVMSASGEIFFMERFEDYPDGVTGLPWKFEGHVLNDLHDKDARPISLYGQHYNWGNNVAKDLVGLNTSYLAPKKGWNDSYTQIVEYETEGRNSAAQVCYLKGSVGEGKGLQGVAQNYYALPCREMMEAMFKRSNEYVSEWGPFEPMHVFDDYWTSSVLEDKPTETVYYNARNQDYLSTPERNLMKRVRSVYTVNNVIVGKQKN